MKKKEIQVLVIEDVPADVALLNHELRKGGLNFRSKRVETRQDFLNELREDTPDVILSDHGLPSFDGFTALAIARDECPGVPFIFVTGALGEQTTIDTFESGATDYVLKSHLSRLVPAVQRALREAGERVELERRELALRESEERFRTLVEGVKDYAIFMLDTNGRVTSWNTGAERMYGYRAEEVEGHDLSILYSQQDAARDRPKKALKTAAAEGRFEEEGMRLGQGGKEFWAHVVITLVRDRAGRLRGYVQVTRNTTERKQAEEALRKSEALKSAILETALDGIIYIDDQGIIQEWNPAATRIFEYSREEALGRQMDELIIPPTLRALYKDGLTYYLMTGAGSLLGRPIELTLKRANGTEFRAELAITRVQKEEPSACTVLIRDITERKHTEAALRESEERFRLMVENVKDYAICMLDPTGHVATWNAGAERITGYGADEILGKPLSTFFTAEDKSQGIPEQTLEHATNGGQARYEGWRVRKDGSRFWVQGIITAIRDETGRICGFSKVAQDVTDRKRAEDVVWEMNNQLERRVLERTAQLEAAHSELQAFTYSVSHDLRAPARHVLAYAQILQHEAGPNLSPESRSHLETIEQAARHLGHLTDALLAFSRTGRSEMRDERVSMTALVKGARADLRHDIEGRDIVWEIGSLPEVRGDPVMLRQVIVNLLSNALKYTRPRTQARIEIGALDAQHETVFFIRDNGVGFDSKYTDKLFGVFQRLHRSSEFEGTGIGLASVRRIIHRHGGRVWAEGVADTGARFYFSLPKALKTLT